MNKLIKRLLISVILFLLPFFMTSFTRYYFNLNGPIDPGLAFMVALVGVMCAAIYFVESK